MGTLQVFSLYIYIHQNTYVVWSQTPTLTSKISPDAIYRGEPIPLHVLGGSLLGKDPLPLHSLGQSVSDNPRGLSRATLVGHIGFEFFESYPFKVWSRKSQSMVYIHKGAAKQKTVELRTFVALWMSFTIRVLGASSTDQRKSSLDFWEPPNSVLHKLIKHQATTTVLVPS